MPYYREISIGEVPAEHPVALFHSAWSGLKPPSGPAAWSEFSPMSVPEILPWLLVLEKQADQRYFYRVCGTGCEQIFGVPYQGKYLGDGLPKDAYRKRLQEFAQVEKSETPLFSAATLPIKDKDHREVFRGVFGFARNSEAVDQLVVVIAPQR
jgi:hypothetical protein